MESKLCKQTNKWTLYKNKTYLQTIALWRNARFDIYIKLASAIKRKQVANFIYV